MRGPTAPIEQQDMDQLIRTVKELRTAFDAFAGTMERPSLGSDRVDVTPNAPPAAGHADTSSSSALSTLRTSLRALRDDLIRQRADAWHDAFNEGNDPHGSLKEASFRQGQGDALNVCVTLLDALIGDTP